MQIHKSLFAHGTFPEKQVDQDKSSRKYSILLIWNIGLMDLWEHAHDLECHMEDWL